VTATFHDVVLIISGAGSHNVMPGPEKFENKFKKIKAHLLIVSETTTQRDE
jgi:hypothetical protein